MAWFDEAIFYHIYPLGMLGAPEKNDYSEPVHRLRELNDWMDHLKKIGITAIYIGPLFQSVGHGYETTDYKLLDSRLGDNDDLKAFVKKCHDNSIRVIFDGVFNHTGRDFFAFKDIQNNRENSRYLDWYCNVNFYGNNEYNDGFSYDNWGGYNLLAKLNQRNPEVRDYICDVIRFWVDEFDVDGIRLDAADVLDFEFMKALRSVANEVKPEFWLMGEVIHGDYTRWVNEGTLHSVTNYTLHKALYSGHNDHNYFEIAHTVKRLYEMGGNRPDGLKLYNFSDNHDVERITTKLVNKANYVPVHILMYTLPGVPSIYYGSEFGIEGKKEKFSDASLRPRLNYEDYKDALKENSFTKLIARLSEVRCHAKMLSYGDFREVVLTNRQYAFLRSLNGQSAIIAVNNDEGKATVYVNGVPDGTYQGAISGKVYKVEGGNVQIDIEANSGDILVPEGFEEKFEALDKAEVPVNKVNAKETEKAVEDKSKEEKTIAEKNEEVKDEQVETEETKVEKAVPEAANQKDIKESTRTGGGAKYQIDEKYDVYDPDEIKSRRDYDKMTIEELQVAILEKMSGNGYIDRQMINSVMENVYEDSLRNWVRSFN